MNKEQEIKYLEGMIVELNKAINNAQQFGDEVTVASINNQIAAYQRRLNELQPVEEQENLNEQEIKHIENMIVSLNQALTNASQFNDIATINAINNQIEMYYKRLNELKK